MLRSVGTANDEVSGGQKIQRVKDYVTQASDITALRIDYTNIDYVLVKKPTDSANYGNYLTGKFVAYGYTEYTGSTFNQSSNIGTINATADNVNYWIGVAKGTYANLTAAKTALTGVQLTYQLANPIVTPVSVTGTLVGHPNGTVRFEPV